MPSERSTSRGPIRLTSARTTITPDASTGCQAARLGPAHWVPVPQIVAGGMLVFLSYEGFELIANASDRIRQPARTLPWAYYGSVGAAILLYMLLVAVTIGHLPFETIARTQSYALAAAAESFMGSFGFTLLAIGAVLAAASAINADLFGASKLPMNDSAAAASA